MLTLFISFCLETTSVKFFTVLTVVTQAEPCLIQASMFFLSSSSQSRLLNQLGRFIPIEVTFPNGDKHIINFKGKLDSVVVDHENKIVYLNDIKTTSKPINFFMDKVIDGEVYNGVISHHHYYRQLACYMAGLQMFMREIKNKKDYSYECNIFAVETTNTYSSSRFRINQSYLDEGLKEFKDLICRVAYLEKYGIENKYPETIDD